ncbi:MAG TPA: response regulator [Rhabdochlamydiaceae bacterium]|nr:response regulator [Rhabdochlamydiaceae bacterium]
MSPPVVLIVSEDPHKLSTLKRILKDSFHVVERVDVKQALELLKHSRVDLIILDARLKQGHNTETARQLRDTVSPDTPILLITSNIKKSFAKIALNSGITDFINLPLDKDEVNQRIAVALKSQDRPKKISQIAQRSTPKMRSSLPLTTREFLSDQAIKEIAKARKSSTNISLLMIELDEFKKIPAAKSSKAQDHLEKILHQNLRKNDILIPQGPGKFMLLLPRTSNRAAEIIAETVRMEVLRTSFSIPLSVSIGLISLDKSAPGSADEVFGRLLEGVKRAADEAKKTGNKIVLS